MFSKHMALVCPPMSGFPAASSSSRPMLLSYLSHRPAVRERRSRARPASPVTLAGGSRYPISIASDAWGRRAVAGTFSLPRSLLVPEPRSGGGTIIARWRGVGQGGRTVWQRDTLPRRRRRALPTGDVACAWVGAAASTARARGRGRRRPSRPYPWPFARFSERVTDSEACGRRRLRAL